MEFDTIEIVSVFVTIMSIASRIVDVKSTELVLTSNDSLIVSCVSESSSIIWLYQQRRVNVRFQSIYYYAYYYYYYYFIISNKLLAY